MATSLLEIVDCGNGEFLLQRSDDEGNPLVTIRFSEESQAYMMGNSLEVAKAMIQAGVQAVADASEAGDRIAMTEEKAPPVLH